MNYNRNKRTSRRGQRDDVENEKGPPPIVRVRHIQKWLQIRYGHTLPNDGTGRELLS